MNKLTEKLYEDICKNYYDIKEEMEKSGEYDELALYDALKSRMLSLYCDADAEITTTPQLDLNKEMLYTGLHGMTPKAYIKALKQDPKKFYGMGHVGAGNYGYFRMKDAYGIDDIKTGILKANYIGENKFANFDFIFDTFVNFVYDLKRDPSKYDQEVANLLYDHRFDATWVTVMAGAKDYDAIATRDNGICVINPKAIVFLEK